MDVLLFSKLCKFWLGFKRLHFVGFLRAYLWGLGNGTQGHQ